MHTVALACNWAPHNLREVAQAIYDYMDDKEPMLPGPDFPTGGIVINKNDIPMIMKTGHGSVKVRARYVVEKNNLVFTELPYGINTEAVMTQIGAICDEGKIIGIADVRNESNKKGFRLVIECEKNVTPEIIANKLFAETDLQTSFSYNQVALVNKTPKQLNLVQCLKIYVEYNCKCIMREAMFDIKKTTEKLHILVGLIKALDIIDDIIATIKTSENSTKAKESLIIKFGFTEAQAKAILDMKLSRLAKLEKEELETEKTELEVLLEKLKAIVQAPAVELRKRLETLVNKYGDDRRTELIQITETPKERVEKIIEPEKVVVVMTESGLIKRIPATAFKTQHRNTKGTKTQDDITSMIIRTNTVDSLMIFSDKGKMYRLSVDDIPVGDNVSRGQAIKNLVEMAKDEKPQIIYSIYKDTDAKYVLFITKNGTVKKTELSEYIETKRKTGLDAIRLRENDSLVNVMLIKDEDIMLITKKGMSIRFSAEDIGVSSRVTIGVKGINLSENDEVVCGVAIRDKTDKLAVFTTKGYGKKVSLDEFTKQNKNGKGLCCYKTNDENGTVSCAALVSDTDKILVVGNLSSVCINASEIADSTRIALGTIIIKNNKILSVSKV